MSPIITNLVTLYTATTEGTFCFTGVCGYDYNISVVDANNCYEDRINVETISLVCPLTINVTNIVNPTCSGSTNGSFIVTTNGGVSPFSYSAINNNIVIIQNNRNFTGLPFGTWDVYVQDSLGNIANTTTILSTTGINPFIIIPKYSANTICLGTDIIAFGSPTEYIITTSQGGSAEVSTTRPVNLCFSLTGCGVETITVCPKEFIYTPLYRFGSDPNDGGSYPRTGVIRHTNGLLYGVSQDGGLNNGGSIYRTNIFNTAYSIRHNFSNGSQPVGELVQYPLTSSGNMYGVTLYGGTLNQGTIYRINSTGGGHQILHNFSGQTYGDGANPNASLLIVNDTIYGTTLNGGTNNRGVIFSLTLSGTYTILHHFTGTTSILARSELILDSNILYGNDSTGVLGAAKNTIFSYNLGTSQFNSYNYGTTLTFTYGGGLTKGSNGLFYGTSFNGGISGNGVLYTCSTINNAGIFYQNPNIPPTYGKLMEAPNGYLYGVTYYGGLGSNGQIYKIDLQGNNFEIIFNNFSVTGGTSPSGVLFHSEGYLYGTTSANGVSNKGSIFKIATENCCEEYTIDLSLGIKPEIYLSYINNVRNLCIYVEPNSLFQAPVTGYTVSLNGNVFGYIPTGSTDCFSFPGCDPIDVKFCTDSTQTCCYEKSFNYSGGTNIAGITNSIQFFSGSPYVCIDIDETTFLPPPYSVTITGNTITGGTYSYDTSLSANCYSITGCGDVNIEIFSIIDYNSNYNLLYSFSGAPNNSAFPYGELLEVNNGILYGITSQGGDQDYGSIFSCSTSGNYGLIYSFLGTPVGDGQSPFGSLIQANNNILYGTTNLGGTYTYGTIFSCSTNGDYGIIYNFSGTSYGDGQFPYGSLLQANNDILYGLTSQGGIYSAGTIFSCSTNGGYGIIYNFSGTSYNDGQSPFGTLIQANNDILYGTTFNGGLYSGGTIFSCSTSGDYGVIYNFSADTYGEGYRPSEGLIQATNGSLYGTTNLGGTYGYGTIFSCSTNGDYGLIYSFSGGSFDGQYPQGTLIQVNNDVLYGITRQGGSYNLGGIFRYTLDGQYKFLYSFSGISFNDGQYPEGSLIEGSDGFLYGMTTRGGSGGSNGTIFKLDVSGIGCLYNTTLNVPCQEPLSLTTIDFSNPCFDNSGFISVLANGGSPNYTYELISWFGQIITTLTGGTNEVITFSNLGAATYYIQVIDNRIPVPDAIILEYNLSNLIVTTNVVTATTGNTVCLTVTSATINNAVYFVEIENTIYPYNNNISPNCFPVTACGLNSIIIYADITYEHDYNILYSFSGGSFDGQNPRGSLIQANNGILYGMTIESIFSCSTSGDYGVIHTFSSQTGTNAYGSLLQANNGILYGLTNLGGNSDFGTIFSCSTSGDYGVIHNFSGTTYNDGQYPHGDLIQANNGILYGLTSEGGSNSYGTIFSCSTSGGYGLIYSFLGAPLNDGDKPFGSLLESSNGLLYGMTSEGGQYDFGTIFSCSTNGGYGIIYNFSGSPDGVFPWASLIEVNGNYLYGTTTAGGQHGWGTIFKISNDGQDYQIIHNFSGFTDGATPRGTLFQSSNGLIYGMTYGGGQYGLGTIFTIDQSDNYQIIYNFSGDTYSDGAGPYYTSFMEGNDGVLYAMTSSGGIGDRGIIFSLVSTGTTGCTFSRTVNVPCVFPPLGFEFINSTLYCCDTPINNARFTVKATGGTGNYSYLLSGITTNSSFNPTSVNPVTDIATFVNITGACENTDWLIIVTDIGQNPPQQLISNVITLNPTFNVNVTFTINSAIVTINGLTNTSNTGQVIINNQIVGNNLFDGTYTYPISCGTNNQVVVNAIQFEVPPSSVVCSYSASSFIPCPFFCDYSFDPIVCPGDTVDLFTVFITGGTPPYTITLTSTNIAPPLSFSTGTTNTTFIFDNTFPGGFAMPAGTWTLTVTTSPPFDSCVNTFTIAPTFNASIIETNSTGFCFTVSGGTQPYEITLDGFTYPIYFNDGTHCLSANCGTHTLFIDNLFNLPTNCPITLNFNIPCAPLSCNVSTVDPNCGQDDGSILVLINGGTAPYTIDVTGPNGYSDTQVTSALSYPFQNLDNGTYIVTVTDFGGQPCVNTVTLTDSFTLNVTVQPINYSIGEICFNISGGLPPYTILLNYSFAWSGTPTSPTQDICLTATCGVNTSYLVFDSTQPCFVQLPTPFQIIEDSGFYDSNKWNYGISFTNCSPLTANTSVGNGSFTYTGITTGGGCQTNATAIQNTVTPNIFGGVMPTSITYQFQLNYGVNYSFFVPSGFAVPYIETPFNSIFDNTTRLMPSPTSAIPPIPSGTDFNNQVFTGTITIPTTVIPTVLSGYGITTALSGGYGVVAQSQYTGFQLSILSYTVDCECAISGNTTIPCLSTPTIGIVSIINPGCDETANGIITVSGASGQPPYTYSATNGTISYTSTNGIFTGLISGTWYLSLVDNLGAVATLPPITLNETFYANIVLTPLGFCVTITGGTPDYLVYLDNTLLPFNPTQGSNTVCYTAECGTTSIITVRDSG